jgi:hypothetical protein
MPFDGTGVALLPTPFNHPRRRFLVSWAEFLPFSKLPSTRKGVPLGTRGIFVRFDIMATVLKPPIFNGFSRAPYILSEAL